MSRYRHEYKYMIDARQEGILMLKSRSLMQPDVHAGTDGRYMVRSLYLDDPENSCAWENAAGTDPRSKFRIRYYSGNLSVMKLEKKSKVRGMCLKESCPLTPEECERMLRGEFVTAMAGDSAIKKRMLTEINVRGLTPKTIVTYERVPMVYGGGNVRITFDRRITSSANLQHFLTAEYTERPVLPPGQSILEIKWDEIMPGFIKDNLKMEDLQWIAFSKYYLCSILHN